MDIRKVKKLIELLEESGIAEIEIHEGEESVRISRGSSVTAAPAPAAPVIAAPVPAAATGDSFKAHMNVDEHSNKDNYSDTGHVITSPMVGVYYASPSPEDPAFVAKGQSVKQGEILCIIEAMKIMNQIESDVTGKVIKVLADNGEAVEYGQPLFVIEESDS